MRRFEKVFLYNSWKSNEIDNNSKSNCDLLICCALYLYFVLRAWSINYYNTKSNMLALLRVIGESQFDNITLMISRSVIHCLKIEFISFTLWMMGKL
jgi:hypothetical protein